MEKTHIGRNRAAQVVDELISCAYEDAMAGSGHPYLVDWHAERLWIARERMIRRLTGDRRPTPRMPKQPQVEYR